MDNNYVTKNELQRAVNELIERFDNPKHIIMPDVTERMRAFQVLLREFEEAMYESSWAGVADPVDRPSIEQEYQRAKQAISDWVLERISQC